MMNRIGEIEKMKKEYNKKIGIRNNKIVLTVEVP